MLLEQRQETQGERVEWWVATSSVIKCWEKWKYLCSDESSSTVWRRSRLPGQHQTTLYFEQISHKVWYRPTMNFKTLSIEGHILRFWEQQSKHWIFKLCICRVVRGLQHVYTGSKIIDNIAMGFWFEHASLGTCRLGLNDRLTTCLHQHSQNWKDKHSSCS